MALDPVAGIGAIALFKGFNIETPGRLPLAAVWRRQRDCVYKPIL